MSGRLQDLVALLPKHENLVFVINADIQFILFTLSKRFSAARASCLTSLPVC